MLKAIKFWVGQEGHVKSGDIFEANTKERAAELIDSGRAIEIKGSDSAGDFDKVETKAPAKKATKQSKTSSLTKEG